MPVGLIDALTALHEHYIRAVNTAVAAGREPLAEALAQQYADDALALILDADGTQTASA